MIKDLTLKKSQIFPQAIPLGSIEAYIKYVNGIQMLSIEEEKILVEQMTAGDISAAKSLVMSHLRFVVHVAKRYSGYNLGLSDLIQEGNVGLLEAIKRFDPKANVRLATYAIYWIKSKINDFVIENCKMVKIATTKAQRKLFFKLRSMQKNWFDDEDAKYVADTLNVKVKDVLTMISRLYSKDTSLLDEQPNHEEFNIEHQSYTVIGDKTYAPENSLAHSQDELAIVKAAIEILDERSALIIKSRWLEDKKKTLSDLSKDLNISLERVRQIEAGALNTLKQHLKKAN
ncbi:MAG: RNA polymerase factor sigma-32 [Gammaproteobacteria bacterium]|nr:RNA polymerase factor sigma-32 [Gammaproteobacteria bacterium]